jgi:hypothetical protein
MLVVGMVAVPAVVDGSKLFSTVYHTIGDRKADATAKLNTMTLLHARVSDDVRRVCALHGGLKVVTALDRSSPAFHAIEIQCNDGAEVTLPESELPRRMQVDLATLRRLGS